MTTALLFPGQGAQVVGMGRELIDRVPAAARVFREAEDQLGFSVAKLCTEGPIELLTRTDNAQVAIYVTSVAAVTGLESLGRFDRSSVGAVAGLSLGEYTALWFAGVFPFAEGLRLVRARGEAMQAAADLVPSGMTALVGADVASAEALCSATRDGDILVIANLNAPGQVVISGHLSALARAAARAREFGIGRAIPLEVAGAFHSPLMEPARARLESALASTQLQDARIAVHSNVTAAPEQRAEVLRELLARQVVSPVLWETTLRRLLSEGVERFYESAPARTLAGHLKKIDRNAVVETLDAPPEGSAP